MHFPKIYNTYFVAIIATVSGILSVFPITSTTLHSHRNRFGFDISSMSAVVGTNQYLEYFDNPHGIVQGSIGSALAAGSVVGSLMAGPISDKFGRRDSIFIACFWRLIGTAVQVACKNFGQLITGRILNGACVGITSSQVPVYLAEIAKPDKRGSMPVSLSSNNLLLNGVFSSYSSSAMDALSSRDCFFPYCLGCPVYFSAILDGWTAVPASLSSL
jgi:MFS family permease